MTDTPFVSPSPVKTSAYTALDGDFVPVDTTSASVTVTLPKPAPDGAIVAVKMVKTASSHTVTVSAPSPDTFNDGGGSTITLSALNQSAVMQYAAPLGVWYVIADNSGAGGGGTVTSVTAGDASISIGGTSAAPTVETGTLDQVANLHAPAANWSNNSHKITSLANGSGAQDAAAFGQIPTSASSIGGLLAASNLSDVASAPAARQNLTPALFDITAPAYGAAGNVKLVTDAAISASGTVLTSSTAAFSAGDTGKTFILNGAGAAVSSFNNALVGTLAYVNSGTCTTSTAATVTVSSADLIWGTDDTAAVQGAVNAMTSAGNSGEVYVPVAPGGLGYMIAGTLSTTGGANSQITFPYPSYTAQKQVWRMRWELPAEVELWTQAVPQASGNAFFSSGLYPSASAYSTDYATNAHGDSAVIGATPGATGLLSAVDGLPAFANCKIILENPTIISPANGSGLHYTAINLAGAGQAEVINPTGLLTVTYNNSTGANKFPSSVANFQNGLAKGCVLPGGGNNDEAICRNPTFAGYAFANVLSEHGIVTGGRSVKNSYAFALVGGAWNQGGNQHLMKIIGHSAEGCTQVFWIEGVGLSGTGMFIEAEVDVETITTLISDSGSGTGLSTLFGTIKVYGNYSSSIFPTKYPTSVKLIAAGGNGAQVPGYLGAYGGFSTAGSGMAVQNPYNRDVKVHFSGGSITGVAAGVTLGGSGGSATTAPSMTTTGLSGSGEIEWPSLGWLSFTYGGAPTWNIAVPA